MLICFKYLHFVRFSPFYFYLYFFFFYNTILLGRAKDFCSSVAFFDYISVLSYDVASELMHEKTCLV